MSKYEYKNGMIIRDGIMVRGSATATGRSMAEGTVHEEFNKDLTFLLNLADLLRKDPTILSHLEIHPQIWRLVQELS